MTAPVTELQYDIIHQSYNDVAHIRDDGITPDYTLDWETRDSFERRAIEVHDEDLHEALTELEDEMASFRENTENEYTPDDLPTTPSTFFAYFDDRKDPDGSLRMEIYDGTLKKKAAGYSEEITTLSEAVTTFEVPFSVAEDSDQLRILMHETDDIPEAYIEVLEASPDGYDDIYQTVTQEGIRETILETSSWQLNYASLEDQAGNVESMLDERIRQMGEPDEQ